MTDVMTDAHGHRWYCVNGVWVPSVTSILSVYPKGSRFERWLGESDSYEDAIGKRDAAGDRGTAVHEAIACLLRGEGVDVSEDADPKIAKLLQGFCSWYAEVKPEVVGTEVFMTKAFVTGRGYAGTCDFLGWIGGEPWVIDWKSSSGVYTNYHLQTSAYAAAAPPPGLGKTWRRGVLWLKTSTKRGYQLVESDHSQEEDYRAFLGCWDVFHREYGCEPTPRKDKEEGPVKFQLERGE